jgi:regulator of cell morphogenesis and NO signaling
MTLERLTVAGIASRSLAAVRVLERHGINYCADSGKSLQDVCAEQNLPLSAVLDELSNEAEPEVEDRDWTMAPLSEVIEFLVVTDHAYLRSELGILGRRLKALVDEQGGQYPALEHLPKVFNGLCEDLDMHMRYEEREVFPAIERFVKAIEAGEALKGSPLAAFGGPVRMMENEHETAGAALRLMRDFAQDYQVPDNSSLRYRALVLGLQGLEDRLLRHMYIENNVLFPRAAALKPGRKTNPTDLPK